MVIVTRNQYILASRIHHITIDEVTDFHDFRVNNKYSTKIENKYNIVVLYTADNSTNGRDEVRECTVTIKGKVDAYRVYKDLIRQIREQMPDALFLDKVLEGLLTDEDFRVMSEEEKEEENNVEVKDDARPKKIRLPGKTKRRSKAVLRRAKQRR